MSEENFTPGPWKLQDSDGFQVVTDYKPQGTRCFGYGCGNDFIADLNDGEYHEYADKKEQEANAYLIAAAPKLYQKLKQLRDAVKHTIPLLAADIDQVLKEARGEE